MFNQRSYNNYQNNQAQKNVAFKYEPQVDNKGKEVKLSTLEKNVYDSASKFINNKKNHILLQILQLNFLKILVFNLNLLLLKT